MNAIAQLLAENERLRGLLEGVSQDAIDGGWTARGLSVHAKRLEQRLAELEAGNQAVDRIVKYRIPIYEVDFGDDGKVRYVMVRDFNCITTELEAAGAQSVRELAAWKRAVEQAHGHSIEWSIVATNIKERAEQIFSRGDVAAPSAPAPVAPRHPWPELVITRNIVPADTWHWVVNMPSGHPFEISATFSTLRDVIANAERAGKSALIRAEDVLGAPVAENYEQVSGEPLDAESIAAIDEYIAADGVDVAHQTFRLLRLELVAKVREADLCIAEIERRVVAENAAKEADNG